MTLFFADRVHVLRPTVTRNRAGEEVRNYTNLADAPGYPRDRVQIRPLRQEEISGGDRDTSVSEWRLSTEPGSGDWDVLSGDWLRLPDGTIATVEGDAAKPSDPLTGKLDHVEILVRRSAG